MTASFLMCALIGVILIVYRVTVAFDSAKPRK